MSELPKEIGRGSLEIAPGFVLEVVNLDNGQRLITEDSLRSFFNLLQEGNTIEGEKP